IKIEEIQKVIEKARDQLENSSNTINSLFDGVQAIINNLSQFEIFWNAQEEELEDIISTLDPNSEIGTSLWASLAEKLRCMLTGGSEIEVLINRFEAGWIQELCTNLEYKCNEYSRITLIMLNQPTTATNRQQFVNNTLDGWQEY